MLSDMNKKIYAFLSIDFNLFLLKIQSEVIEIFSDLFFFWFLNKKTSITLLVHCSYEVFRGRKISYVL